MTQDWTLTRGTPNGQSVIGVLDFGGGPTAYSLERLNVMIPEGRYRVTLTVSNRATRGTLWSPSDDHKLPELANVPGRTAIRIHAGNASTDSDGCILAASDHSATELEQSRPVVTQIVNMLRDAAQAGDDVWLTVRHA